MQCLLCCYSPPRALAVPIMVAPVPPPEEWLSDGTVAKLWEMDLQILANLMDLPFKEHDVAEYPMAFGPRTSTNF